MDLKIKLKKPLTLGEGDAQKTISEVDLSGLMKLTGRDILKCRREAAARSGSPVVMGALDDDYRVEIAAVASGLGVETLLGLSAPDYEDVDGKVKSFLLGLD